MKTKRILGIVWLALGSIIGISSVWCYRALWQDISAVVFPLLHFRPSLDFSLAMLGPVYLFSAVAGVFLFRGARWASIAIGVISLLTVIVCVRGLAVYGLVPDWDCLMAVSALIVAVISVAALSVQRHHQVA